MDSLAGNVSDAYSSTGGVWIIGQNSCRKTRDPSSSGLLDGLAGVTSYCHWPITYGTYLYSVKVAGVVGTAEVTSSYVQTDGPRDRWLSSAAVEARWAGRLDGKIVTFSDRTRLRIVGWAGCQGRGQVRRSCPPPPVSFVGTVPCVMNKNCRRPLAVGPVDITRGRRQTLIRNGTEKGFPSLPGFDYA
ncbi:hypothetical protein Bbelb_206820 [Branchiostoma belcheri]|nr:hypothetical protein Bbelb_206820 [Branchiostoma belcheri]